MGVVSDAGRGLFRGCYFGEQTRFAVLDVDQGSRYHNRAELHELTNKLSSVGIAVTPYQSSDSGGWHLYLFFDDWAESAEVSKTLKTWLKLEGYEIKGGVLEVFPSGNALRLPLQPGFAWLDSSGEIICRREEINETEAVASFLSDLENNASSWAQAKRRIEREIEERRRAGAGSAPEHKEALNLEGFEKLWSVGRNQERIEEAQYYLDNGLQEKGKRHDAIYAIEHLLWYGDPDRGVPKLAGAENDERREEYLLAWLRKNHNGNCRHVNRGNWRLLEGHVRRVCRWRGIDRPSTYEKTPYAITEKSIDVLVGLTKKTGHVWKPEDLERANQKREKEARAKIREALEQITSQGRKVTIKGLADASGCDRKTVRKHSDIHGIYQCRLSKWGSHLDPGGRGDGSTAFEDSAVIEKPLSKSSQNKKILLLSGSGSEEKAVAPGASCQAEEPTRAAQCQNQGFREKLIVLTPGPERSGIEAGKAGGPGGIFVCSKTHLSDGENRKLMVSCQKGGQADRLVPVCASHQLVCSFSSTQPNLDRRLLGNRRSRGPPEQGP